MKSCFLAGFLILVGDELSNGIVQMVQHGSFFSSASTQRTLWQKPSFIRVAGFLRQRPHLLPELHFALPLEPGPCRVPHKEVLPAGTSIHWAQLSCSYLVVQVPGPGDLCCMEMHVCWWSHSAWRIWLEDRCLHLTDKINSGAGGPQEFSLCQTGLASSSYL